MNSAMESDERYVVSRQEKRDLVSEKRKVELDAEVPRRKTTTVKYSTLKNRRFEEDLSPVGLEISASIPNHGVLVYALPSPLDGTRYFCVRIDHSSTWARNKLYHTPTCTLAPVSTHPKPLWCRLDRKILKLIPWQSFCNTNSCAKYSARRMRLSRQGRHGPLPPPLAPLGLACHRVPHQHTNRKLSCRSMSGIRQCLCGCVSPARGNASKTVVAELLGWISQSGDAK